MSDRPVAGGSSAFAAPAAGGDDPGVRVEHGQPTPEPLALAAPLRVAEVAAPDPASTGPPRREPEFGLRRFLESAILFAIAVLTLRCIALEPFGVPTGSMATTMIGNHKSCACPRCGFRVVVGSGLNGKGDAATAERAYATAWCPNCGRGDLHLENERETVGDRVLVDKSSFELRPPHRWEVAVFRNPSDMSKPYVKRVVGLPGETVQVRGGDVRINDVLARKSLAEARPLRVLVFDNDYQPPGGWKQRWLKAPTGSLPPDLGSKSLATADEYLDGTNLKWPASPPDESYRWIIYRHWLLDENRETAVRDWFAYNGGALQQETHEVHDFFVEFEFEAAEGRGELALKLSDGQKTVTVEVPVVPAGGAGQGVRLLGVDDAPAGNPDVHLSTGQTQRVEFAFVDRRIMFAIDGREAFAPVDLPEPNVRRGVSRPVWIGARGAALTIRHFRLFRDVYYTPNGRNAIHDAWPLGRDEYFLLGDNSANSEDSRFWQRPGVPESNFLGRPLLLHQPSRWSILGKWELQCVDWDRIRWIR